MTQAKKRYPVRVYDNGGETNDRYTIVFTKGIHIRTGIIAFVYIGANSNPTHPAYGFWQHGETVNAPVDKPDGKHLGKRIPFRLLPEICQKLVIEELTTTD